jgi:L-ascorbate metabolism protein UlaG (beta-lactamase superfamily)
MLDKLHWLGHDSFRIDGPPVIYIDPWKLKGRPAQADLVLVSHEHHDHCSAEDIDRVRGPNTVVIASPPAAAKLGRNVRVIRAGEKQQVGAVTIEAVPAYNVGKRFHPKEAGGVGFVITLGEMRLYFAGDTDLIPEMAEIECDVALLPVSGTYVMTAEEAARAAGHIQPHVAVPMHYGAGVAGTESDAQRFKALCPPDIEVRILEIGD